MYFCVALIYIFLHQLVRTIICQSLFLSNTYLLVPPSTDAKRSKTRHLCLGVRDIVTFKVRDGWC